MYPRAHPSSPVLICPPFPRHCPLPISIGYSSYFKVTPVRTCVCLCAPEEGKNMINSSLIVLHKPNVSSACADALWKHCCIRSHTRTRPWKGEEDLCWRHIKHLPLIAWISSVCFTLFAAILLKSLISCVIEQPVYTSQPGCDGCVCWTSFHLTDVMVFWNQSGGTLRYGRNNFKLLVDGRYKRNDGSAAVWKSSAHVPVLKRVSCVGGQGAGGGRARLHRVCQVCIPT